MSTRVFLLDDAFGLMVTGICLVQVTLGPADTGNNVSFSIHQGLPCCVGTQAHRHSPESYFFQKHSVSFTLFGKTQHSLSLAPCFFFLLCHSAMISLRKNFRKIAVLFSQWIHQMVTYIADSGLRMQSKSTFSLLDWNF